MSQWFNSQPRIIQVIFLLVPPLNWIVEIMVRWSVASKNPNGLRIFWAIFVTLFGLVWGYIDIIWCILFNHLIFAPDLPLKNKSTREKK